MLKRLQDIDWAEVDRRLLLGADPEQVEGRKALFLKLDPNGNGLLSLSEAQAAIPNLLSVTDAAGFKKKGQKSETLIPVIGNFKPAVCLSFAAAKELGAKTSKTKDDGYVDKREFHAFLVYFRNYVEVLAVFLEVDTSDDMKVLKEEALEAEPVLAKWGMSREIIDFKFAEAKSEMKFDDFADWCMGFKLRGMDFAALVDKMPSPKAKKEKKEKAALVIGMSMEKPENQKAWATAAASTLNENREHNQSLRNLLQQCAGPEFVEAPKVDDQKAKAKSAGAIASFEARILEVKEAIKRVGEVYVHLSHECKSRYGQLQLCEQRIELREKRPPSEIYKDNVQEALENEQKVVTDARAMLQKTAKECSQSRGDLEMTLLYLGKDMAKTRTPPATLQKSVSLPQIVKSPQESPAGVASTTKSLKQVESASFMPSTEDPVLQAMKTDELIKCAISREERAALVVRIGTEVLSKVSQGCDEASQRVSFCLEKKTAEVAYIKKELHEQVKDTNLTLAETDKVFMRLKRTHPQTDSNLQKIVAVEALVKNLEASKQKLEDNYRCKTASLNVDQSCKLLSAGKVDARRTMKPRTDEAKPGSQ